MQTRHIFFVAWLLLTTITWGKDAGQDTHTPLPDGWKKARFGMSSDEVLERYPDAVLERDEAELLLKTYALAAPTPGIGRVTFYFFKDRLFKVALNFDLTDVEQRFQIRLFEKKYGPCQQKDFNWRPTEKTTKLVWVNPKYMIQLGQLITTPGKKGGKTSYYLAAIYTDVKVAAEHEEYAKNAAPRKHVLGWDDFFTQ